MSEFFKLVAEVGFPIASSLAGGYFVFLTLKFILAGVLSSVNGTGVDSAYIKTHADFIRYYRMQDWERSKEHILYLENAFKGELREYYKMMLERINELELNPPGKDWDGVYRAGSK
jgi:hypothetical protein